jgi:hypothetical protein
MDKLEDILIKLHKNQYIFVSRGFNAISIYDDKVYDRSDLDILNPAQRQFIIEKLKGHGFKLISGNVIARGEEKFEFLKNAHIGSIPGHLIDYSNSQSIMILTVLQMFSLIISRDSSKGELSEELYDFISCCPVNLEKVKDICKREEFFEFFMSHYNKISEFQEKNIKENLSGKSHI